MSYLEKALQLAIDLHSGQVDKLGEPYILHPLRVMSYCKTEDERVVAILHDVVEDTDFSFDDLLDIFPEHIVDAIEAITHRKKEPRIEYYDRVKANDLALKVKLADIADNTDPERLARLDDATRKRLIAKYEKAVNILL